MGRKAKATRVYVERLVQESEGRRFVVGVWREPELLGAGPQLEKTYHKNSVDAFTKVVRECRGLIRPRGSSLVRSTIATG